MMYCRLPWGGDVHNLALPLVSRKPQAPCYLAQLAGKHFIGSAFCRNLVQSCYSFFYRKVYLFQMFLVGFFLDGYVK